MINFKNSITIFLFFSFYISIYCLSTCEAKNEVPLREKNVAFFSIKSSFKDDYPSVYDALKKEMLWDWGLLDLLKKGDTISFIVDGLFEKEKLTKVKRIYGFGFNSKQIGKQTLMRFTNHQYGDFFSLSSHNKKFKYPSSYWKIPVEYGHISSFYGMRKDPFTKKMRMHNGVDILAKKNTPVRVTHQGVVSFVGTKDGFGKTVIVKHKNGIETLYAHLSRIKVNNNNKVKMGNIIGFVGNTGKATTHHLHFSVYKDGKHIDPLKFPYRRNWRVPRFLRKRFTTRTKKQRTVIEESLK